MDIREITSKIMDEIDQATKNVDEDQLIKVFATLHNANRLFFHTNGRSLMTIKYYAQRLMHQGYRVFIVNDVATPAIKEGDALVLVSACGEEANLITAAKTVKEIGSIKLVVVTADENSTLGKMADVLVKINVPVPGSEEDKSIQPIGAQFEQAVLYIMDVGLSHYTMARLGITLEGSQNPLHANLQ